MVRKAKKYRQAKSPFRGIVTGIVTAGVTAVIYSAIFRVFGFGSFLFMAGVSALTGYIAYVMGSGLDTSIKAPTKEDLPITGNEAVDLLVKRGQDMLRQIRKENDRIPDPVLSRQIDEMESVSNKIFRTVIEQPSKAPQIRRFMDYYLPTTLKMLSSYRRMDEQNIQGNNAEKTKKKIEDAMEVVLSAFKKQLDTLYQNDMLDISSDIDVLETLLKQDSLLRDDRTMTRESGGAAQAQQMKEE
ncbi:MAG: hypothetical protein GX123_05025 [Clostridiales bacterium]|jgi:5-bromo-4-chloroindolyl phosphate hydrolysis protein|nr:5-bromo-4-chloroindolyl phosphate hydrolysis family protein [Eubacteriales bacterium]MDD4711447.1 5-bromo-4-chloroindolyl phosphate hydrolysis family protein [Eubacteriales bacterium]NLO15388.1 hypothetical protein [Clostridiales bacterium]